MPALNHPQTLINVGSRSAEVDVALAPLIEALWQLGIDTEFSCQGSRFPDRPPDDPSDWGQILFPDIDDLRRFLDLFGDSGLSTSRFHLSKRGDEDPHRPTTRWLTRVLVEPAGKLGTDTFRDSDAEQARDAVQFRADIRFPSSHIAAMTRIVISVATATTPPPFALGTA